MKTFAVFLIALLFWLRPASAADFSDFYTWADDMVVKTEFRSSENLSTAVIIRVKNDWDRGDVRYRMFRHWLPTYVVCKKNSEEVRWAEQSRISGFSVYVILADTSAKQINSEYTWIPASTESCNNRLKSMDEYIRRK
jgi:hypothetical protein